MNAADHQRVIDDLQTLIDNTQHTLDRFEATGMDKQMPEDYETLLAILNDAVKQQREHTLVMLGGSGAVPDWGLVEPLRRHVL